MEKILQAFRWARLQEAVGIYYHLLDHGFSMEDLALYLKEGNNKLETMRAEDKGRAEEARKRWCEVAPTCPKCKGCLSLKHICKKKGPGNREGWTCLWFCESGNCIYEKYTYEDAGEEMKRLMERGRKE